MCCLPLRAPRPSGILNHHSKLLGIVFSVLRPVPSMFYIVTSSCPPSRSRDEGNTLIQLALRTMEWAVAILALCFLCQPFAGLDLTPTVLRKDSPEWGAPGGPPTFLISKDSTVVHVFLFSPLPVVGNRRAGAMETEVALGWKSLPAIGVFSWVGILTLI